MINERRAVWQMLFLTITAGCVEREELRFEEETPDYQTEVQQDSLS